MSVLMPAGMGWSQDDTDEDDTALCSDCGKPQHDPIHVQNTGQGGDEPTDDTDEDSEDDEPQGDGKTGDEPHEDEDDEDDDGDETGDDDGDDDEPTGKGKGTGDDDEDDDDDDDDNPGKDGGDEPVADDKPVVLPDEMGRGAGLGAAVPVTDMDRDALQKAVDENALLEGDAVFGKGQVLRSPHVIESFEPATHNNPTALGAATAAIRAAFMRSKTGVDDFEGGLRRGRLSGRDLWKVSMKGEDHLFGQRRQPGINKYNMWVLVDCSGSMGGRKMTEAAAMAQAFATATATIGTIRTSVWGWTGAFANNMTQQLAYPAFGACLVYSRGDDPIRCNDLSNLPMGGTPDAPTMAWAIDAIRKDSNPGEEPIIVFVSDGMGYGHDMADLVKKARKVGIKVIGVNIGGGMVQKGRAVKDATYGEDYIPWQGGIVQAAGPLARVIARIITPR